MRKDIVLPGLALAGGVAGFALRRWQLASAFQPEAGLFTHGAPATYALIALCVSMLLLLAVLVQHPRVEPDDFLPAFSCPQSGQMTVLAAAGLLFVAAGLLGLREGMTELALWRVDPQGYPVTYPVALLLTALLALPSGAATLLLGRAAYRETLSDAASRLASLPAFCALVWLFLTHLEHGTEPVLMRYGFTLAAAGLLMLAHYYVAGFLFSRPRCRRAAFCALSGAVLGLVSLADGVSLFHSALTLALVLSALAYARALLHSSAGLTWPERMPSGAQEDARHSEQQTDI